MSCARRSCGLAKPEIGMWLSGHPQLGRLTKMIGIFLIVLSSGGCRHPAQEPVTLTFLDPEWSHDLTERNVLPDERLLEFTRQTGIRVKNDAHSGAHS